MGWKVASGGKAAAAPGGDKLRFPPSSAAAAARSRMKLWLVRATTTVLLWTCVVQLTAVGDTWGPRVLKGWPSCLTPHDEEAAAAASRPRPLVDRAAALPPKSEFASSSFLWLFPRFRLSFALFRPAVCALDNHNAVPSWTLTARLHRAVVDPSKAPAYISSVSHESDL